MLTHAIRSALPALLLALTTPLAGVAQAERVRSQAGSVSGAVIDAGTGQPLAGAVVTLQPAPGGLLLATVHGSPLAAAQSLETSAAGEYRFAQLAPGRYRLRIERLGYRSTSIEIEVTRPVAARVSVGLELAPVVLEAVHVQEQAAPPFRRAAATPDEPEAARMVFERERQSLFVTSDSRALTWADVVEGITLGETDVFRALQRFPGVSTRDDYTAELWTRGAPWAQTRVTFDELPLFNPVHAVGLFSGLAPDILGAVFFQPGYRSVAMSEGAAGAVDLRSRPGGGDGRLRGAADVSMASARLELDQRVSERAAWIVSARRSYLDVLQGGLDWLGLNQLDLPYAFHDIASRVDLGLGERSALEASGIWEEDRLFGDVEGILEGAHANWGNAAGRITLRSPLGPWRARHTFGLSRYRSQVQESADSTDDGRPAPFVEPPADNRVLHLRLATTLEPWAADGKPARWSAGWEVTLQETHYDGPEPRFHPVRPDTTVHILRADRLWTAGAWAETRLGTERITLVPGLRLEGGGSVTDGGALRLSPRLALRVLLTPDLSLSAAVARNWQSLQAIALAGPSAHPAFHASQFWLLAGADAPAIRADIVTLGGEYWLARGWLGSVNAYFRKSGGVTMPDPAPGPLADRPLFVTGENRAWGLETGVRRVAGRWTSSLGYTWAKSENDAAGLRYPAATDRRHRVEASLAVNIAGGLRLGVAYAAMSGAPYTRVQGRMRTADCSYFGFGCNTFGPFVEAPNARRTPDHRSLDAIATFTRRLGGVQASAYVQLRNVLGRENAITYAGSIYQLVPLPRSRGTAVVWEDRFEKGVPRLPLLGARIAF
jgi:hypothetical protein